MDNFEGLIANIYQWRTPKLLDRLKCEFKMKTMER
jgi:hypothetical protein